MNKFKYGDYGTNNMDISLEFTVTKTVCYMGYIKDQKRYMNVFVTLDPSEINPEKTVSNLNYDWVLVFFYYYMIN